MPLVMSKEEIALRRRLLFRLAASPDRFARAAHMRISDMVDPRRLDPGQSGDGQPERPRPYLG